MSNIPNWAIQAAHEIDHFYIRREQDDENEESLIRPNLEDIAAIFLKWFPARAEAREIARLHEENEGLRAAMERWREAADKNKG